MPEPDPDPATCPFCFPGPDRVAFEHRLVRALWDAFPASPGHLLIVPRRHVATWFDATEAEQRAIIRDLAEAKELIESRHRHNRYARSARTRTSPGSRS